MSIGRRWQDVEAEAHLRNPELADAERRVRVCAELDACGGDATEPTVGK